MSLYNEETVMADLDMENEAGSVFSYNANWDDMSESQYSQNRHYEGRSSSNKYSNRGGKRPYYQKKNTFELIGPDHYRTVISGKGKNLVFIEFFMTKYYPGIIIRNAITGYYEKERVGKSDEDLYFKVKVSIGNYVDGHLYYNSPEEYERHWQTTLPLAIKQTWLEKYTKEFELRNPYNDANMTMSEYILSHDENIGKDVVVVK
jgi:hypothetical protein